MGTAQCGSAQTAGSDDSADAVQNAALIVSDQLLPDGKYSEAGSAAASMRAIALISDVVTEGTLQTEQPVFDLPVILGHTLPASGLQKSDAGPREHACFLDEPIEATVDPQKPVCNEPDIVCHTTAVPDPPALVPSAPGVSIARATVEADIGGGASVGNLDAKETAESVCAPSLQQPALTVLKQGKPMAKNRAKKGPKATDKATAENVQVKDSPSPLHTRQEGVVTPKPKPKAKSRFAKPRLTKETLAELVVVGKPILESPENSSMLKDAIQRCKIKANGDALSEFMAWQKEGEPMVWKMLCPVLAKYGFTDDSQMFDMIVQMKKLCQDDVQLKAEVKEMLNMIGQNI